MDLHRPAHFCGVVLAGGTAARMDGIDKASVELHGRTLLELAIDAFLDADEVVVVAPTSVPTTRPVTFVVEDPPRGGPVAGLLTGVDALTLVTEWNEFREPDFGRMRKLMRQPVIFDGRNIYNPEQIRAQGFTYFSMGRPSPS